jgi:hypothetical protein
MEERGGSQQILFLAVTTVGGAAAVGRALASLRDAVRGGWGTGGVGLFLGVGQRLWGGSGFGYSPAGPTSKPIRWSRRV